MLEKGQILWWVDYAAGKEGTVTVVHTEETRFCVSYQGKTYYRPYSAIGTKLFLTPQLQKEPPVLPEKSCSNCFHRHAGTCTTLKNALCEDYRMKQTLTKEEMDAWPAYGDATAFRMKKKKPIIKEKW